MGGSITSRHSIFLVFLACLALLLGWRTLFLGRLLACLLGLGALLRLLLLLSLSRFVSKHLALLVRGDDDVVDNLDPGVDGELRVQDATPDAELFKEKLRQS